MTVYEDHVTEKEYLVTLLLSPYCDMSCWLLNRRTDVVHRPGVGSAPDTLAGVLVT